MISVRTETRRLEREVARFGREILPETVAASMNVVARAAHSRSLRNIRSSFTLRNRYTERSLKFWQAKPKRNISRINAVTGTISEYLPLQEAGGRVRARRRRIPIPTRAARVGRSRSRVVAARYRLNRIGEAGRGGVFIARSRSGKLGLFVRTGRRVIMIRDLSVASYRLEPTHWHTEATRKYGTKSMLQQVFIREARRRLGRIR